MNRPNRPNNDFTLSPVVTVAAINVVLASEGAGKKLKPWGKQMLHRLLGSPSDDPKTKTMYNTYTKHRYGVDAQKKVPFGREYAWGSLQGNR